MVALSLAELPGSAGHLVLAMGGLDNKIHLYCGETTGKVCDIKYIWSHLHFHFSWLKYFLFSCLFMHSVYSCL